MIADAARSEEADRSEGEEVVLLRAENERLRAEVQRLRDSHPVALQRQLALPSQPLASSVTNASTGTEKVRLFRQLFRGRDDVYALRWERPNGEGGYAPAAASRTDREQRNFLPLTDQAIEQHLTGRQTVGLYPLLLDERCWFLAADFDKEHWQEDALAYLDACDAFGVPAALERSRSGHGGHVWIFFASPVPAIQARDLGCALLTAALAQRRELGLDSYDRLFPSQDTMPKGGFGNLIALPLQGGPRRQGNSLFVDRHFEPYRDQWALLSSLDRTSPAVVSQLAAEARKTSSIVGVRPSFASEEIAPDPWTLPMSGKRIEPRLAGPFPSMVTVTLANLLYVPTEGMPASMLSRLWRLAGFENPEFHQAQALRFSTFGKPRVISCAEEFPNHIGLPRGCFDDAVALLQDHGVAVEVHDERQRGNPIDVQFRGILSPAQQEAADALVKHDNGVLCAPTGFGKTVVAASVIAERRVSTLVLVHRRQIMDQWQERLTSFLGPSVVPVGQIGGGRNKPTGVVDVAVMQSLLHAGEVAAIVGGYGQVIVDECHHVPALTFERLLKGVKARFVLGLTATPVRKDGHHPIVIMQCGPIRFRLGRRSEDALNLFSQVLVPRTTAYLLPPEAEGSQIQRLYASLVGDRTRNDLICSDVLHVLQEGRTPLVLTERTDHLVELASRLHGQVQHLIVLRGGMGAKQRRAVSEQLASVPAGEQLVVLATGRYAGEGFDMPRLDTLLLALPISWRGTLQQYAGRLHRSHPGKHEVRVYDYVDGGIPVLAAMYQKRLKGYKAMGYSVAADHLTAWQPTTRTANRAGPADLSLPTPHLASPPGSRPLPRTVDGAL